MKYLAILLLFVVTGAAAPITNNAEWKNGKPVGLPGAKRPKVESVLIYQPTKEWTYSHHQSITFFKGRFFAIWSNGRVNEDDRGQRVLLATSKDFFHWTEPRPLVDSIKDDKGEERVLTAAGFHEHAGTLVAYFGNYGFHKETTHLQAVTTTDGDHWSAVREVGIPINPNHPPQRAASGRLIIAGNISFPWSDDPTGLAGWHMTGIYPASMAATIKDDPSSFWEVAKKQGWNTGLCEGSFYQTDDGVLHMLLRNAAKQNTHRLWLTESRDNGATWSTPVETEFSDTNAKFHFGRLPDGRFYYVGNPVGGGRTPLALSLSRDGVKFDQHFILGETHYEKRAPGTHKGGEYGYPHTLIHDGYLYVIVSRQKEAVEVLRVGLTGLRSAFDDAIAVWHFGDLHSADGKSPLMVHGAAKVGVAGDGADKVAEIAGGWFDAGQGGDGRLNLKGNAMTMLLRLRNPSGKWSGGELFCKHGGHDKLVYNLFVNGDRLGFEFGADGRPGLAGQVTVAVSELKPKQWHDVIVRYDGTNLVLFLDGVAVGRAKASGALRQGNTEPVLIGRRGFTGQLDHAALWQRALSDDEVVALSGGEQVMQARREALGKQIEAKIGREGLTLADQLRGARELRQRLWSDPHRPRYHLLPPDGFWNDINGTIYWKGRYHVFFLGRIAPDRDTILSGKDTDHPRETWLHASSRDLVHWIHHPPALVPVFDGSMPRGLYSGDMMDNMPVPTIIVHVPGQGTCLFTAEDEELIRWKPHPNNPVIPSSNAPPEAVIFDPCGWKEGDVYYALVGNKNKTPGYEGDSTSLFRSRDLAHWEYRGPFYKSDRHWTQEYEDCACPDFFPLGNKHVLISHVHRPWNHLQYYIGRFDKQAERFLPESHGYMSWPGGQLCAPETLLDDKGRRIFWGWIMEARPATNGWASVASLPRVLALAADNSLRIEPAPELDVLRYNHRSANKIAELSNCAIILAAVRGDCLEISLVIEPGDAKEFGLKVRCSPDGAEETGITCTPAAQTLKIELGKSTLDSSVKYQAYNGKFAQQYNLPLEKHLVTEQVAPFELKPGEPLRLRVFLDRSVLEVFANDRQCITQRIYPSRADSLGVALFARGGKAKVKSFDAWDINPTNSW